MSDLLKYNYFKVTAKLIYLGFRFYKEINYCNEEWINYQTGKIFKIKKSSDFLTKDELLHVLYQAGISLEEFINF